MKTKYDWSNVPKQVNYLAVDEGDDFAHGFRVEPFIQRGVMWVVDDIDNNVVSGIQKLELRFDGNWQNSLEERPK